MADVPVKETWRRPGTGAVEGQVEFQAVIVTDVGGKTLSREIQTVPLASSAISTALAPGEYEVREEFVDSWATYRIVVPDTTAEQRLLTLRNAYAGALEYAGSAVAALLELLDATFVSSSELTSAINAAVSPLLGVGAAETLNSISEIAIALGNDPQRVANLVLQVSALATSVAAKYSLPAGGVPKSDLAAAVQTSLGKADAAVSKTTADASYAPRWQANETLTAGTARLLPIARVGTFKADGTTGATFDPTKWNYPRLTFTGTTAGAPTSDIPGATTGDIYVDSTGAEYTIAS